MKPESLRAKKYRIRVSKEGVTMIDSASTINALRYARAARISWRDIARAADMDYTHVERIGNARRNQMIYRSTRQTILQALGTLAAERITALEDTASAVQFALEMEPADSRRWPMAPLLAEIDRVYGTAAEREQGRSAPPLRPEDRRYLHRSDWLDSERAARMCKDLGFDVECVWPAWFELESA